MSIVIRLFIFVLKIIYFFLKLLPTKNKITFISRQSNNINDDFKLLIEDLNERYSTYKTVVLTKKIGNGLFNKIKYVFHIFRQMYHIATSKVVVLDSYCIPVSLLKHKKDLKVIQMWHALGAFKKFGLSIKDKKEGTSTKLINIMKMHQHYDYVFTSSPNCKKFIAEAFGYNEDNIVAYPLPRLDMLKNKKYIKETNTKIFNKYPELKNKKNILYAPTFRIDSSGVDRKRKSIDKYLKKLIDEVDFKKYNLIIKFHPLSDDNIDDERVIVDKTFKTTDFLNISDYVITDYSAIVYEAAYLNKPLYFYSFDIKEFIDNRDFYLDIKNDMPGIVTENPKEIIKNIENNIFDMKKVKEFSKNNIVNSKKTYTEDINDFIIEIMN